MNRFFVRQASLLSAIVLLTSLMLPAAGGSAQTQRRRRATEPLEASDAKKMNEAAKKSASAARVFDQIMGAPDNSIPKE